MNELILNGDESADNNFIKNSLPSFFVHETAIVDEGAIIGNGVKIWHFSHVMGGAVIGDKSNLGQNVFVASGVQIGMNVKIQNNVSIYEGVTCEDDVFLGPSMVFTNVFNPRSGVDRRSEYRKTIVKKGVTIGANATIICGITIGEYAFIGAGAVVTKDIKPYALVVGNPAKQTGWMSEHGMKLSFLNRDRKARCTIGGDLYLLKENYVKKVQGPN